jgi:hypothetical protein
VITVITDAHGRSIDSGSGDMVPRERDTSGRPSLAIATAKILSGGLVLAALLLAVSHVVAEVITALTSTSVAALAFQALKPSRRRGR